jgi:hypothetical protein
MEINGKKIKNPKEGHRYCMILQSPDGKLESMCHHRVTVLVNELIRLRDGHNWKVIKEIKKLKGMIDDTDFYPYPNQGW